MVACKVGARVEWLQKWIMQKLSMWKVYAAKQPAYLESHKYQHITAFSPGTQALLPTSTCSVYFRSCQVTDGDAPTAISLLVTPLTSGTEPFTIEAAPQPGVTGSTYTYSLALDVGDSLRLEPSAPGLLLYPASRVVEHTEQGRGCQPDVGVFEARPGLQLRGSTEPPIEGKLGLGVAQMCACT